MLKTELGDIGILAWRLNDSVVKTHAMAMMAIHNMVQQHQLIYLNHCFY